MCFKAGLASFRVFDTGKGKIDALRRRILNDFTQVKARHGRVIEENQKPELLMSSYLFGLSRLFLQEQ